MPDYDKNEESNCSIYEDANDLYKCSMSEVLKYGRIEFVNDFDVDKILKTLDGTSTGYIIQVDIDFPIELNDEFKEYSLASETFTPELEWLSEYHEKIGQTTGVLRIITLTVLINWFLICLTIIICVFHDRRLKILVELRGIVKNTYRVISFKQRPWLKSYLDFLYK